MSVSTHSATHLETSSRRGGVGEVFRRAIWGIRCGLEAERLLKMSDGELARRGISRNEIVSHAFPRFISM